MSAHTAAWLAELIVDATRLLVRAENYQHNVSGVSQQATVQEIKKLCLKLVELQMGSTS